MQHRHHRRPLWLPMHGRPTRVPVTRGSVVIGIRQGRIIIGMRVTGHAGRMWGPIGWLRGIMATAGITGIGGGRAD